MKSIILSTQPYYYYHIVVVKDKKIELRKTIAKPPFTANLYCSKNMKSFNRIQFRNEEERQYMLSVMGKVGASFECDRLCFFQPYWIQDKDFMHIGELSKQSCVSVDDIMKYCKNSKCYGLNISALKINDKPRELGEFKTICKEYDKDYFTEKCYKCNHFYQNELDMITECNIDGEKPITRPPQNYMYCEED